MYANEPRPQWRIQDFPKGGSNLLFGQFPQICMKIKKIEPRGRTRGVPYAPSPNPLIMYNTALTAASEQVKHNVALHILLIHLKERKQNGFKRRIARKVYLKQKCWGQRLIGNTCQINCLSQVGSIPQFSLLRTFSPQCSILK